MRAGKHARPRLAANVGFSVAAPPALSADSAQPCFRSESPLTVATIRSQIKCRLIDGLISVPLLPSFDRRGIVAYVEVPRQPCRRNATRSRGPVTTFACMTGG